MRLATPFIRLPYRFDAQVLAEEVANLPASAWRKHPSGLPGNSAAPLISRDGASNDDFYGEMHPTPALDAAPRTEAVMRSFGEVLGRSRFMRLEPGARVPPHVDFNYHWRRRVRIHVPIITEPDVLFTCGAETRHLEAGEAWIFDSWLRHHVTHDGSKPRVHLVVDLAGSSRFWAMVNGQAEAVLHDSPLRCERCNIPVVMSPGELELLVAELMADLRANPDNDAGLLEHYGARLDDFSKDWHEVWLLHGDAGSGWPAYRSLIQHLRRQLHPKPRALTTASNNIGANPIITQRILAPALTGDQL